MVAVAGSLLTFDIFLMEFVFEKPGNIQHSHLSLHLINLLVLSFNISVCLQSLGEIRLPWRERNSNKNVFKCALNIIASKHIEPLYGLIPTAILLEF